MPINLIVAMDKGKTIGKDNSLPWHLPEDLKHVKNKTIGNIIVMGRKTYDSIGKPLPNRTNVILTRDENFHAEGCLVVHSKKDVLELAKNKEVFIFGGSEIFKLFEEDIERAYVTFIDHTFEGDTIFPLDLSNYEQVSKVKGIKDDKNPYDYYFLELIRKD